MNTAFALRAQSIATFFFACSFLFAIEATALDGYRDRRGLFGGLSLGGGVGAAATDGELTGIDKGRKLGMHLSGILGAGATRNFVFAAEGNWWGRTVLLNDFELEHNHFSLNAVGEFFLVEGLYLEGGAGIAYGAFETLRRTQMITRYGEMGLAVKGGGGVEFFAGSDMAFGLRVGYTRHFYQVGKNFDTISAALSVRWY